MTVADLDYLDFGMLVDILVVNQNDQEEQDDAREATQADFDKF